MENKSQEENLTRVRKNENFEVRLIKKIVNEIEGGVPRKLVYVKYGVSQSTVNVWMRKYGSVDYISVISIKAIQDPKSERL